MHQKVVAWFVLSAIATPIYAVDKKKAMYVGGTVTVMSQKAEGSFDLQDPTKLIFRVEDSPVKEERGKVYELPWKQVEVVEYGQKVSHRVMAPLRLRDQKHGGSPRFP